MPDIADRKWCEFLECEEDTSEVKEQNPTMGVTFKPRKGNAVFWENLRSDGRGYEETCRCLRISHPCGMASINYHFLGHAGLPLLSGWKVGLNIWSWGPARRG